MDAGGENESEDGGLQVDWSALIEGLSREDTLLLSSDEVALEAVTKDLTPGGPDSPLHISLMNERLKRTIMCESCGSHVREIFLDHVRQVKDHTEVVSKKEALGKVHRNIGLVLAGRQKRKAVKMAWKLLASECRANRRCRAIVNHCLLRRNTSRIATALAMWRVNVSSKREVPLL